MAESAESSCPQGNHRPFFDTGAKKSSGQVCVCETDGEVQAVGSQFFPLSPKFDKRYVGV